MYANQLIGKNAIRTKPTSFGDHSYTEAPIKIVVATESHIVYEHARDIDRKILGDKKRVLNFRWCDDAWIECDELLKFGEKENVKYEHIR